MPFLRLTVLSILILLFIPGCDQSALEPDAAPVESSEFFESFSEKDSGDQKFGNRGITRFGCQVAFAQRHPRKGFVRMVERAFPLPTLDGFWGQETVYIQYLLENKNGMLLRQAACLLPNDSGVIDAIYRIIKFSDRRFVTPRLLPNGKQNDTKDTEPDCGDEAYWSDSLPGGGSGCYYYEIAIEDAAIVDWSPDFARVQLPRGDDPDDGVGGGSSGTNRGPVGPKLSKRDVEKWYDENCPGFDNSDPSNAALQFEWDAMNSMGMTTGRKPGEDQMIINASGDQTHVDGYRLGLCLGGGCSSPQPIGWIGESKLINGPTIYYDSQGKLKNQARNHINALNPYRQQLVGQFMVGLISPTLIIVSTGSVVAQQVIDHASRSAVTIVHYRPEKNPSGNWTLVGQALNPIPVATMRGSVYSLPEWLVTNPLYNGLDAFDVQPTCPD